MNWHWLELKCLEASGCASTKRGWQPLHLLVYSSFSITTSHAPNKSKEGVDVEVGEEENGK
jgi:predicted N-acyltransferase